MAVQAVICDWEGTLTPWHVTGHGTLWRSVCEPHFPAHRVSEATHGGRRYGADP